jgi:hypothetical protein
MERRLPADNALPHFLAMMVRAPRAVDLLAKSADPPRHPPKDGARSLRTMAEVEFARGHTL